MHKLLIVDDEWYAVEAVMNNIDWAFMGFVEVLCAYDADEAKELLLKSPIDIMICDIEMPQMNGIQLLEWMNEHMMGTVTIFLTGHADFQYAQLAVRHGGFDYLLKPVDYDQLQQVVMRALKEAEKERDAKHFLERFRTYEKLMDAQQPLLTERFWQDVFSERIRLTPENAVQLLQASHMALDVNMRVLPILLSVEYWKKEFNQRDEEILEYALRNSASEILLEYGVGGDIVSDRSGILFGIIYLPNGKAGLYNELKKACERYIEACSNFFYCSLSCYIGEAVTLFEATHVYHRLIEMEHANVTEAGTVYLLADNRELYFAPGKMPTLSVNTEEWTLLLEKGRNEELLQRLEMTLQSDPQTGIHSETLDALYHTLLGFVYQLAHKKGISVKEIVRSSKWMDAPTATRSVSQFLSWARKLITMTAEYIRHNRNDSSALIDKVKGYIDAHLATVTREEIASVVYLNSAYLSRLFKRETGQSLVEFIIGLKITKAKHMLMETNVKICDISDSLGYEYFSHFAKMFKKQVGITPQEYRKRYQHIGK